jgi:hypothetical protein
MKGESRVRCRPSVAHRHPHVAAQESLVNTAYMVNPLSAIVLGVLGALGALVIDAERRRRATRVPARVAAGRNTRRR